MQARRPSSFSGLPIVPNTPGPPPLSNYSPPRVSNHQAPADWPKLEPSLHSPSNATGPSETQSRSPSPSPSRKPAVGSNLSQGAQGPKPPSSPSRKSQFTYAITTDHRGRDRSRSKSRNQPTPSIQVDDKHVVYDTNTDSTSIRVLPPLQHRSASRASRSKSLESPTVEGSPGSGRSLSPSSPVARQQPSDNVPRASSPGRPRTINTPSPSHVPRTMYSSVSE